MMPADHAIARVNARGEKLVAPFIQTPQPNIPWHLYDSFTEAKGPLATSSGTCTPSSNSTIPSPSSTLVSLETLSKDQDHVSTHFLDAPPFDAGGNPGFKVRPWVEENEIALYPSNRFVDFSASPQTQRKDTKTSASLADSSRKSLPTKERTETRLLPRPFDEYPPRMYSRHRWQDKFDLAVRARDPSVVIRGARAIVSCGQRWTEDAMFDLARAFVWGASDRNVVNASDHFAQVATSLRTAFAEVDHPENLGEKFSMSLRDAVIGTFLHCWDIDNQKAIVYVRNPKHNQSQFVLSALAHCKFVGSLYGARFLIRSETVGCIRVLFKNFSVIEHLIAVRNILFQAGTLLWQESMDVESEMKDFERHLIKAAQSIECDRAVLPQSLELPTVNANVGYILRHLKEFAVYVESGNIGGNLPIDPRVQSQPRHRS